MITVVDPRKVRLPIGVYALIELYCTDPECDCRNVYIHVVHETISRPVATIGYGWESLTYYKKWMGIGEEDDGMITQFKGPDLAFGAPQSQFADECLRIFKDILQTDKAYAERLERHYQLVKGSVKQTSAS